MPILKSVNDPELLTLLENGRVGVLPTDTIYGLAARAGDEQAVARLYGLKRREGKPGTIIAASPEQLIELGLDAKAVRSVAHLWPNPISIVIPDSNALGYLDQGLGDLAVRIPSQKELRDLLAKTGPLLTSSANHPGEQPANNIQEARQYFGEDVDFYVDGGDLSGRPPSTVVRIKSGRLEVLRQGAVIVSDGGRVA